MIHGDTLRAVMRNLASPVTVVTAAGRDEIRGITIGSFTSVSLDPPLVGFNLGRETQMHGLMEDAAYFAVHLLHEGHAELSNHFALPDLSGEEQFRTVRFRRAADGTPLLDGVMAVLHCRVYARYAAGDHTIVLGEVLSVEEQELAPPLLYFERSYHGVGPELAPGPFAEAANPAPGDSPATLAPKKAKS